MLQTVEAVIDEEGKFRFLENANWCANQHVLVTFLQATPYSADLSTNYTQLMQKMAYAQAGQSFNRDELNER